VELEHEFTVPTDIETAWATLLDLEGVAPCFPGATLTGRDGDAFTGRVAVKLGPVSLQYAGRGRFVERDDATHRAVIEAHGTDRRGNGTAGATVVARLEPLGGATRVVVATQLKVTGRPAQFGRGVLQDVGERVVEQFADNLASRLTGAPPAAPPPAPVPPPPVPLPPVPPREPSRVPQVASGPVPPVRAVLLPPPRAGAQLDLGVAVLPVLARRYAPTAVAVLVTALVTWRLARRR